MILMKIKNRGNLKKNIGKPMVSHRCCPKPSHFLTDLRVLHPWSPPFFKGHRELLHLRPAVIGAVTGPGPATRQGLAKPLHLGKGKFIQLR